MDSNSISEMLSPIWNDISFELKLNEKIPYLSHYTSALAVEQILKGNEIWLSNVNQMNDYQEHRYGIQKFWTEFRSNIELMNVLYNVLGKFKSTLFYNYFEMRIDALKFGAYDKFYVFCMSAYEEEKLDGRLSMWRGYGQGALGVALVTDPSKISLTKRAGVLFGNVGYRKEDELREWANNLAKSLSKILYKNKESFGNEIKVGSDKDYIHHIVEEIFNRVRLMAIFTKHPGFSEENEWRIVINDEKIETNLSDILQGYKFVNGDLRPVLRVKLTNNNLNLNEAIQKIIVGPTSDIRLTYSAFKALLKQYGHENLISKVHMSDIPFRR